MENIFFSGLVGKCNCKTSRKLFYETSYMTKMLLRSDILPQIQCEKSVKKGISSIKEFSAEHDDTILIPEWSWEVHNFSCLQSIMLQTRFYVPTIRYLYKIRVKMCLGSKTIVEKSVNPFRRVLHVFINYFKYFYNIFSAFPFHVPSN